MMKLKIHFEGCYGIKALEMEFDFSKSKSFAILTSYLTSLIYHIKASHVYWHRGLTQDG